MATGAKKISKTTSKKITKRAREAFFGALKDRGAEAREAAEKKFPELKGVHKRLGKGYGDLVGMAKNSSKTTCNCAPDF